VSPGPVVNRLPSKSFPLLSEEHFPLRVYLIVLSPCTLFPWPPPGRGQHVGGVVRVPGWVPPPSPNEKSQLSLFFSCWFFSEMALRPLLFFRLPVGPPFSPFFPIIPDSGHSPETDGTVVQIDSFCAKYPLASLSLVGQAWPYCLSILSTIGFSSFPRVQ